MKTILNLVILIIVLGGIGWFAYQGYVTKEEKGLVVDEHAGLMSEQDRVNAAMSALIGVWRSVEDAKFVRTYRADGTATDTYEDEPSANVTGAWSVFMKELPDPDFTGVIEPDVPYVKMTLEGEHYFFKIGKATPEELELIFMDRGGALTFTRVQ